MPTYSYQCEKCSASFELFFHIKDYIENPKCSQCQSTKTVRNYMLDVSTQMTSIKKGDNELKTLGDLADRNRDKMSNNEKQRLHEKHNQYRNNKSKLPGGLKRIDTSKKVQWTDSPQKKKRDKQKRK